MFYGAEIMPELLADIAQAGNPEAAEMIAESAGVALPKPLSLDVSRSEWPVSADSTRLRRNQESRLRREFRLLDDPEKERRRNREAVRKWAREHPGKVAENSWTWHMLRVKPRKRSPETKKRHLRAYRLKHPEIAREHERRRRARKRGRPGRASPRVESMLFAAQKGLCWWCKVPLILVEVHVDHVLPLGMGGLHDDANLALSCAPCNLERGGSIDGGVGPLALPFLS
jgi:5-methylcytosine-specific restriction endonuclease McrA